MLIFCELSFKIFCIWYIIEHKNYKNYYYLLPLNKHLFELKLNKKYIILNIQLNREKINFFFICIILDTFYIFYCIIIILYYLEKNINRFLL
jgi:hypothetical protein